MKYGIVISVSKTKFGPIVFKEDLDYNINKAASLGYDGIELAIRDPKDLKIENLNKLLVKNKLEIISIGTGQLYCEEGLSLSDPDINIRDETVKRIKKIIDIAKHFNASIIIGMVRGNIKDLGNYQSELQKAEIFIRDCLEELLSYSEKHSQKFLLEPANRYELNIFNRIDEVDSFLKRFRSNLDTKRIGVLADTFHMNIEESKITGTFRKYSNLIRHIHFADSNRCAPGYGHINFKSILRVLNSTNYKDFVSFEMLPKPSPDMAALIALKRIKKINDEI